MREPMQWTFPIGRLFEVAVRIHIILPLVLIGLGCKAYKNLAETPGAVSAIFIVGAILTVSILLHEFGHVFAARAVGGDCEEVVLWPLGGLALCDLPSLPRAHMLTALAGPFVNLGLCILTAAFLLGQSYLPPYNLFSEAQNAFFPKLFELAGTGEAVNPPWYLLLAGRIFILNWALLWLNLLPAFPMDGGRVLHAIQWARTGDERAAAGSAAYFGFGIMLIMCCVAIYLDSVLLFALAVFIYLNCRMLLIRAETGMDETGAFDTESDESAPPRRPRPSWLQRWRQERAKKQAQKEQDDKAREEHRLDELLDKVQRLGRHSLTSEEERFLTRVSTRYRNNRS